LFYPFTNCNSPAIFTSSLTKTPPVSKAAFQFRPKSLLLIFPSKVNPALVFPQGSWLIPPNSTSNCTGLVTPLMVKCPVTLSAKEALSKVMLGFGVD
jgi:hypothetical protein